MPSFREQAERDAVFEDIVDDLEGFEVLQDALGAVAETGQRQDAQEAQDPGGEGLREDVGPGAEDGGLFRVRRTTSASIRVLVWFGAMMTAPSSGSEPRTWALL